jgi:outer membrane protein OmpA-like peptidoglycan-associated protein
MRVLRISALFACLLAGGVAQAQAPDPDDDQGQGLMAEDPAVMEQLPQTPTFRPFLPERVDLSPDFPPPGDQGKTQTCVGWSTGYALRSYLERKRTGVNLADPGNRFSPYFVYTQIAENCNSGARISDALAVQGQIGALPIRDYTTMNCNQPPGPADKARAGGYRIGEFRRVRPDRIDDVKGELARGRPVPFGMMVTQEFMRLRGDDIYDLPPRNAKGGHAMVLVGYDDARQAFKLINSWGPKWGDRGYGWVSYRAFAAATHSAFTVDGAPATPVAAVTPPPATLRPQPPAPQPPAPQPAPAVVTLPAPRPAPPPPAQPARASQAELVEIARGFACTQLSVSPAGAVTGFVGTDEDKQRLASAGGNVSRLLVAPWPQCETLLTLERPLTASDGLEATLRLPTPRCPKGTLCENDRMILEVKMPKHPAHLIHRLRADERRQRHAGAAERRCPGGAPAGPGGETGRRRRPAGVSRVRPVRAGDAGRASLRLALVRAGAGRANDRARFPLHSSQGADLQAARLRSRPRGQRRSAAPDDGSPLMRALILAAALIAAPALAQAPPDKNCTGALKAEDIVNCLAPPPAEPEVRTRGGLNLRGVTVSKDVPVAKPPSVNLWINFAYNSADLTTDARISLEQLARALKDPNLSTRNFAIAGHTDAAGTAEYNRALSERRANAVREFLMREAGIKGDQLQAEGHGFSKPINTADPRAAENRRVEVTLIER